MRMLRAYQEGNTKLGNQLSEKLSKSRRSARKRISTGFPEMESPTAADYSEQIYQQERARAIGLP